MKEKLFGIYLVRDLSWTLTRGGNNLMKGNGKHPRIIYVLLSNASRLVLQYLLSSHFHTSKKKKNRQTLITGFIIVYKILSNNIIFIFINDNIYTGLSFVHHSLFSDDIRHSVAVSQGNEDSKLKEYQQWQWEKRNENGKLNKRKSVTTFILLILGTPLSLSYVYVTFCSLFVCHSHFRKEKHTVNVGCLSWFGPDLFTFTYQLVSLLRWLLGNPKKKLRVKAYKCAHVLSSLLQEQLI